MITSEDEMQIFSLRIHAFSFRTIFYCESFVPNHNIMLRAMQLDPNVGKHKK
jgi:hypothetical protein